MAIDHVQLHQLRGDLSLRPLTAEALRLAHMLLDDGPLWARRGSDSYGALLQLQELGLASRWREDPPNQQFEATFFLGEIDAAGLWHELEGHP